CRFASRGVRNEDDTAAAAAAAPPSSSVPALPPRPPPLSRRRHHSSTPTRCRRSALGSGTPPSLAAPHLLLPATRWSDLLSVQVVLHLSGAKGEEDPHQEHSGTRYIPAKKGFT
ncbi:unnamed protein product, partial [Urochloa humidicola]